MSGLAHFGALALEAAAMTITRCVYGTENLKWWGRPGQRAPPDLAGRPDGRSGSPDRIETDETAAAAVGGTGPRISDWSPTGAPPASGGDRGALMGPGFRTSRPGFGLAKRRRQRASQWLHAFRWA